MRENEIIKYTGYAEICSTPEQYLDVIKNAVENNVFPGCGEEPVPHDDYDLTLQTKGGKNIYVVSLDGLAHTRFGENASPISSPCEHFAPLENYISDVILYYVDKNGNSVGQGESDNWEKPANCEKEPKWASFILDNGILSQQIKVEARGAHGNEMLFLPLYFNLVGKGNGIPNWVLAAHGHKDDKHIQSNKNHVHRRFIFSGKSVILTHEGPHKERNSVMAVNFNHE